MHQVDAELKVHEEKIRVVGYYEGGAQYKEAQLSKAGMGILQKIGQLYETSRVCLLVGGFSHSCFYNS